MSSTTDISSLPTDPSGGGSIDGNISLKTNEIQSTTNSNILDQTTINQIITGLQQASTNGATNLPSRDIPRSTGPITQDVTIQPNYIPQAPSNRYIEEIESDTESREDMIREYNKTTQRRDNLDNLYNEIQVPLLLSILYFIFQLPIFRTTLFKYLPFLFNSDGNINLNGLLFMSGLYGFAYYVIFKSIYNINSFL
jgi:hypothetical protein